MLSTHNIHQRNGEWWSVSRVNVDRDVIDNLVSIIKQPIPHIVKKTDERLSLKTVNQNVAFRCAHDWSIA